MLKLWYTLHVILTLIWTIDSSGRKFSERKIGTSVHTDMSQYKCFQAET